MVDVEGNARCVTIRLGWLGAGLVVAAAGWCVLIAAHAGGDDITRLISNGGQAAAAAAAGTLCLRRARRDPASRRLWLLVGLAATLWAAGQAVWTAEESVLGADTPFPSPADVGFLGCGLLFVLALATADRRPPPAAPIRACSARRT